MWSSYLLWMSPDRRLFFDGKGGFSLEAAKFTWVPHLDGFSLKETPIEAIRAGRFNSVPLLVGSNRDEFKLFTVMVPGIRELPKSLFRPMYRKAFGKAALERTEELYPYRQYHRPLDAILDALGDMALTKMLATNVLFETSQVNTAREYYNDLANSAA